MKKLFILLFAICTLNSFGQLIVYSCGDVIPCDTSDRFTIDTLKTAGDTAFVVVKHFIAMHLLHQEEQLFIDQKIICKDGKGADKIKSDGYRVFCNGHSTQWYPSGQKKCEGIFRLGEKLNDWKYWDENGERIIQEPIYNQKTKTRGKRPIKLSHTITKYIKQ